MTTFADAVALGREESGLVVLSTSRADGTIQSTVVNAGPFTHPATGVEVLALVIRPGVKLRHLRARPQITATFRSGWRWATIEGTAELIGPDDPDPAVTDLPKLLREVFTAAGGTHDDWAEYDRVMAAERRAVVLVVPTRVYTNPG